MTPTFEPHTRLVEVIRQAYGLDLGGARAQELLDCLAQIHPDVEVAAQEMLLASPARLAELVECTTNNETYFFRHAEQLSALASTVADALAASPRESIRVWSAGCSSGEEPVSLAILLREALVAAPWTRISVLGTDLHRGALRKAVAGRYTEWSFRGVTPELRDTHFVADGAHSRPNDTIRSLVTYRRHNLLEGAPEPVAFDVVTCRNVLIYFDAVVLERALAILSLAVVPGGYLVLGPAESPAFSMPDFELVFRDGASLYRRKRGTTIAPPPLVARSVPAPRKRGESMRARASRSVFPRAQPKPLSEIDAGALLQRARDLADRRAFDSARSHVLEHRSRVGDVPEARVLLAMIALEGGAPADAVTELEQALALDPSTAVAHYLLGSILDSQRQSTAAEAAFTHALQVLADQDPAALVPFGGGVSADELIRSIGARLGEGTKTGAR